MTTLAIIGSGISGRSLLYTLAKEQKSFEKITLFHSDTFFPPCSLSSTAIVAPRGVTTGHSDLGNLLVQGYESFRHHFHMDHPEGVEAITQYTGAHSKLDNFKKRYPHGTYSKQFFHDETYIATEEAFLIDPKTYLDWLLKEADAIKQYHLEVITDVVKEVQKEERVHLKTLNGRNLSFDKVIFTGGVYNRFWNALDSKPAQGSYLEFDDIHWNLDSFSLTLDGHNLIWNKPKKRLLLGSTTEESQHFLAPLSELQSIYQELERLTHFQLPPFETGKIKVGLREKAKKREPYIIKEENIFSMGGFYKNGFILSLKMANDFSRLHL